jgi:hypothetical protein
MSDQFKSIKEMTEAELMEHGEQLANDYRDVLTCNEKYDYQTGAVAIVQEINGGPETRKVVMMNSGTRTEKADVPAAFEGEPGLVQPGPFAHTVGGKRLAYVRGEDGELTPYDPKAENDHHAEMKIVSVIDGGEYEILVLVPTRGCCEKCQQDLKDFFGGEEKFKQVVPDSRQTPEAFAKYWERLHPDAEKNVPTQARDTKTIQAERHVEPKVEQTATEASGTERGPAPQPEANVVAEATNQKANGFRPPPQPVHLDASTAQHGDRLTGSLQAENGFRPSPSPSVTVTESAHDSRPGATPNIAENGFRPSVVIGPPVAPVAPVPPAGQSQAGSVAASAILQNKPM